MTMNAVVKYLKKLIWTVSLSITYRRYQINFLYLIVQLILKRSVILLIIWNHFLDKIRNFQRIKSYNGAKKTGINVRLFKKI